MDSEPLTHEEVENALAKLIRRDKPSVQAIALWLRLHPAEDAEDDPFAEFLAR